MGESLARLETFGETNSGTTQKTASVLTNRGGEKGIPEGKKVIITPCSCAGGEASVKTGRTSIYRERKHAEIGVGEAQKKKKGKTWAACQWGNGCRGGKTATNGGKKERITKKKLFEPYGIKKDLISRRGRVREKKRVL